MRTGQRHLVQCQCVLPQYRKLKDPVFHKFTVFSVIDNDVVEPKYVQCNNCGAVHKVYDICKSEIIPGKDELRSVATMQEISISIPSDLRQLLETYNCDITVWEHIKFSLQEQRWGDQVVITRESIGDEITGKVLTIAAKDRFTLENYIIRETVELK